MILDEICKAKLIEINKCKKEYVLERPMEKRHFGKSLLNPGKISIIGEIKKASPSKGLIRKDFDLTGVALEYEKSDVQCISVLTEEKFFLGNKTYINDVRTVTGKPILRKDFILDPCQIYESKELGADAILLIAAILNKEKLREFIKIAESIDLECLVEVHDKGELFDVLKTDAKIIGINNRDLKTFNVDIRTTYDLLRYIPKEKIIVSESGIESSGQLRTLYQKGVDAVLIGEYFMSRPDISDAVRRIRSED